MTQADGRGDTIAAGGLLAIALLLGGGSSLFPFHRMVVELAAVLVLAWFCLRPRQAVPGRAAKAALVLIALAMLLLLAQVLPLPPSLWKALPGRADQLAVYAAVGEPDRWAPLSLNPAATRDAIAFFLAPVAMFVAAMRSGRDAQRRLLWIIAAFCLLNGMLVVLQFQGLSWLTPYSSYERPGTGLFANKNHSALFIVAAMPAVVWVIMNERQDVALSTRRWIAAAITAFLSLTVVGCLSRAGLAMLPLGVLLATMMIVPPRLDKRRAALVLGGGISATLLLVLLLPNTAVGAQALARFDTQSDLRYQFWPVVAMAIKTYFPAGSGFGTFQPVFAAIEPMSIVKPTFVNHAHSDYMEIALEGGLAGIALVVGFLVWFVASAFVRLRVCRPGMAGFAPLGIAVAGVIELLLHSILDYPLRTLALAMLVGVYCAILATRPTTLDLQDSNCYRRSRRRRARTATDRASRSIP